MSVSPAAVPRSACFRPVAINLEKGAIWQATVEKSSLSLPIDDVPSHDFLRGGGEMGALTRAHDWAKTPLGPPAGWPQSLKTAVRLLLTSQHPMFIWWGPELIQFYNDAYRQTMGPERHPSALGQRGYDCWTEIWDIIGPQIESVMAGNGATWHVDQLVPVTRHGRREDVWWTYGFSPIDIEDQVGGVLVVCNDVTKQHILTEQLREANLQLADETIRLRQLFHQSPGFMCILRGPQHIFEFTNASYSQLIGQRDVIGKTIREALPELADQRFFDLLDQVYASGEPFVGRRLPVLLQAQPTNQTERRYVDFVYQPILDKAGKPSGIFVEGSDVTDHVHTEESQQLLIRELHHRVKNTLATVQGILGATARSALNITDFHEAFAGRLISLGKTHTVLTESQRQEASIHELLRLELEPYDDGTGHRIKLDGPDVRLPVTLAVLVGLAFHELATNAAKYGALSDLAGVLEVNWAVEGETERRVHIKWAERNGPPVAPPKREGFGSRLLSKVLPTQADVSVEMDFAPTGLRASISLPIDKNESP
jgi:two-component sensor histidine kinase